MQKTLKNKRYCRFAGFGYKPGMRKSLGHLPKEKQAELMLVTEKINDILSGETDKEKELFELLDYAYIGARYDMHYKITKQQLGCHK